TSAVQSVVVSAFLFGTPGEIDATCGGNTCIGQGIDWSITDPGAFRRIRVKCDPHTRAGYHPAPVCRRPASELASAQPRPYTPAVQVCPSCGEENPDRFRLCGFCGAQLVPDAPKQEVRKTV